MENKEVKQEGLWDHSPPSKTFPLLVNNLKDVFLRWKCLFELDWKNMDSALFFFFLSTAYY